MQNKYFVFDYTPISDKGLDYVLIGMADKNPSYVSKPDPEPIEPVIDVGDDDHTKYPEKKGDLDKLSPE